MAKRYDFSRLQKVIYENEKEYRLVVLRRRGKYIAKDGDAINPFRPKQKATISYNKDGYPCFGGSVPIHLYVAHGWVDGYSDGLEVDHKDFNRCNYNADNLQWIDHKDNVKRSAIENSETFKMSKTGENNGRAKFTEQDVLYIRKLYDEENISVSEIIRKLYPNISQKEIKNMHSNITNIVKRRTWKHLK